MRDFGAIPAPMNAYLLNVGLETLHLRMPPSTAQMPWPWPSLPRSTPRSPG